MSAAISIATIAAIQDRTGCTVFGDFGQIVIGLTHGEILPGTLALY